ncbi:hypothetical protein G7Y89_g5114 [Cudoniella acicularis]|uniref:Uncharacterized protein n=1 Tax=Cudoniella acicularis TaxID=354080 RepID=A0A8H4RQA7_9HELO|nr:hypothetical protein G7Y89_g5114 [Cudoniella acicularis]
MIFHRPIHRMSRVTIGTPQNALYTPLRLLTRMARDDYGNEHESVARLPNLACLRQEQNGYNRASQRRPGFGR